MAARIGLTAGSAMDLRIGNDFSNASDQERAKEKLRKEKPRVLIGSPECKMFSVLQHLSPWTIEKAKKLREPKAHMSFMCE